MSEEGRFLAGFVCGLLLGAAVLMVFSMAAMRHALKLLERAWSSAAAGAQTNHARAGKNGARPSFPLSAEQQLWLQSQNDLAEQHLEQSRTRQRGIVKLLKRRMAA